MGERLITCPSCGGNDLETTTAGVAAGPDINRAVCRKCGWDGVAEDCKPRHEPWRCKHCYAFLRGPGAAHVCKPTGLPQRPRWVLVAPGRDPVSTSDPAEAYDLAAVCRDTPDAVLYLELPEPVRVPVEFSRVSTQPQPPPPGEKP